MASGSGGPPGGPYPNARAHVCDHEECASGSLSCLVVQYCGTELCGNSLSEMRWQYHTQKKYSAIAMSQQASAEKEVHKLRSQLKQAMENHPTISEGDNTTLRAENCRLDARARELESQLQQKSEAYTTELTNEKAKFEKALADAEAKYKEELEIQLLRKEEAYARQLEEAQTRHEEQMNGWNDCLKDAEAQINKKYEEAISSMGRQIAQIREDREEVNSEELNSAAATQSQMRGEHEEALHEPPPSNMANAPTIGETPASMCADAVAGDLAVTDANQAPRHSSKSKRKSKKDKLPTPEVSNTSFIDVDNLTEEQEHALLTAPMDGSEASTEVRQIVQLAMGAPPHLTTDSQSSATVSRLAFGNAEHISPIPSTKPPSNAEAPAGTSGRNHGSANETPTVSDTRAPSNFVYDEVFKPASVSESGNTLTRTVERKNTLPAATHPNSPQSPPTTPHNQSETSTSESTLPVAPASYAEASKARPGQVPSAVPFVPGIAPTNDGASLNGRVSTITTDQNAYAPASKRRRMQRSEPVTVVEPPVDVGEIRHRLAARVEEWDKELRRS